MCGIIGTFNLDKKPIDKSALLNANDMMFNRGPDDSGFIIRGSFGMAMRRLSIIGINNGKQPISNNDENIHVVLNGEIYNHIELKKELISKGYSFKTDSDVEVLVHLYEEYGIDCISRLNGMFAFALWDDRNQRLWIARDRLGIKPLFYAHNHSNFSFSSDINSLLSLINLEKKI